MIAHDTVTLWVCTDCVMLAANGEMPDVPTDPAPLSALPADADITCGLGATEHDDECPNVDHDSGAWIGESDCDCETREFSWSDCDGCGSPLGGSRHALTLWTR